MHIIHRQNLAILVQFWMFYDGHKIVNELMFHRFFSSRVIRLHLFVPTPLCSYTPMFLHIHPYVPTPLCSYTPMFRQPMFLHSYVPTTYVPTPLCSYTPMFLHPMFLHHCVPTPLCSYAPMFLRPYIPSPPPLYSDTFY